MRGGVSLSGTCPCILDKGGLDRKTDDIVIINKKAKHSVAKSKIHSSIDLFLSNSEDIESGKLIKNFFF
jgi:hypothetical protein